MPRKYIRKPGVIPREIDWTEEDLVNAFVEIKKGERSLRAISKKYKISTKTLRRRYEAKNFKLQTQGKCPVLGFENEKRLVQHILKLDDAGFPPDQMFIRRLAFQYAINLKIKHTFKTETEMAGSQWLQSFLERNPSIAIRKPEKGEEVRTFFNLFMSVLKSNDLLDTPDRIFNMDEMEVELNNKVVKPVPSGEKGETVTLVACCSAIGNYLPPVVIIKGVLKKRGFDVGLPPGSKVYMQKKSAYITSDLFHKWLTEHFIPFKPQGKVLLILDGDPSHFSAINMLETARKHDVILLCLPNHTTSVLQPLDKFIFEPFKHFYTEETNLFMSLNDHKKLSRHESNVLLSKAWNRAATPINAISAFRGSGLYPVNPNALSGEISANSLLDPPRGQGDINVVVKYQPEEVICQFESQLGQSSNLLMEPQDSYFQMDIGDEVVEQYELLQPNIKIETPLIYIPQASPVPSIPSNISKRADQAAEIVNSVERIEEKTKKGRNNNSTSIIRSQNKGTGRTRKKTLERAEDSTMENVPKSKRTKKDGGIVSPTAHHTLKDFCVECFENCNSTKSKSDLIACKTCGMWLHDACTVFKEFCMRCGKLNVLMSQ